MKDSDIIEKKFSVKKKSILLERGWAYDQLRNTAKGMRLEKPETGHSQSTTKMLYVLSKQYDAYLVY